MIKNHAVLLGKIEHLILTCWAMLNPTSMGVLSFLSVALHTSVMYATEDTLPMPIYVRRGLIT